MANSSAGAATCLSRILTSSLFKSRLDRAFGDIAWDASERAAPVVADTIRTIGYANAVDLIRGGPTAATSYLRGNMGSRLIDVMAPDVGNALHVAQEPLVGQLLSALTGVNISSVANGFANQVRRRDLAQIGFEESAIRRDPKSTNDPVLIGVLGVGQRFVS